jgi:flagellar basal-body rod protein FlgF
MENASYIALSHQMTLRRQMDVIANNVANSSTPAFKVDRTIFVEELVTTPDGQEMTFVQDVGLARDTTEGAFTKTGNDLDLAIRGEGYLVVDTPFGERYTRNGRMGLDSQGQIVTSTGHVVLDEANVPIVVPEDTSMIQVSRDGTLSTGEQVLGRLRVVRFDDEQELSKEGESLYVTAQVPLPASDSAVVQGMVEESNVEPIIEITTMILALRAYEAAQRIIDSETELQAQTTETLTTTT